ncbi:MATE family efflux transporter [Fusobacterium perfoetens]|uniref:MATE family efflux transporter n=1 Tax=Fusobacterium perfoetens TaxID=852 RepID=UPI000483543F|nr:MATE family efflux transporter [Fusobacterium perfoetens]
MKTNFETENITTLFFKFAIPGILGMLIVSAQTMIDGIFLGRALGPLGLAGVNLSMPLVNFLMSVGLMICIGGGVIASIYRGNKKLNNSKEIATITLSLLFTVLEVLSIIIILNLDFFIKFLGANKEIYNYVKDYLLIMILGTFFFTSPIFTETFIRIEEKPNYVFLSGLIGLLVNVSLDYLFIVKLNLGMKGGALATIMASSCSFLALIPNIKFKKPKNLKEYKTDIKNIFYNGSSEMLTVVASTVANYLFNRVIMKKIGVLGVSALTIVFYINQILNISLYGLSQALQPIVAYNVGAKNFEKIKKVLKISFISGGTLGVIVYIGSHIFGIEIIKIFAKNNQDLIILANEALFFISFAYLIEFLNIVSSSFLTAIERPLESVIVSLCRSIIFVAIPLFILPNIIGPKGIWMTTPIAEFLCLLVSFYLMKKSITYLKKRIG